MVDVFISYARDDYDLAIQVKERIEAMGLTVYFDVEGLDGGDVFPDVLDEAVKTASVIVGVWTPHSLTRPWVKTECLIGKDRKCLIPVIVEPVQPLDVPAAFYGLQTIDLIHDLHDPNSHGHQTLARSLSRTLKRPELMRRPQPQKQEARPQPKPESAPNPRPNPSPRPALLAPLGPVTIAPGLRETAVALALLACGFSLSIYEIIEDTAGLTFYPMALAIILAAIAGACTGLPRWAVIAISLLLVPGFDRQDFYAVTGFGAAAVALVLAFDRMRSPAPDLDPVQRRNIAIVVAALVFIGCTVHFSLELEDDWIAEIVSFAWVSVALIVLAVLRLPLLTALAILEAPLVLAFLLNLGFQDRIDLFDSFVGFLGVNIGIATILSSALTLCLLRLAIGDQRVSDRRIELALVAAGWILVLIEPWLGSILGDLISPPKTFGTGDSTIIIARGGDMQPVWLLTAAVAVATGRLFAARPFLVSVPIGIAAATIIELQRHASGASGEYFHVHAGLILATIAGVWLGAQLAKRSAAATPA